MVSTSVEYQDFTAGEKRREYRLRVRRGAEFHVFTVAIPNEAFVSGRVRYQDAPEICYLKILREIETCGEDALPARALVMTDQELEEYRVAHAPKTPGRRS
jgi:hypothetical protein